jgi:hypothetical protein
MTKSCWNAASKEGNDYLEGCGPSGASQDRFLKWGREGKSVLDVKGQF